MKIKHALFAGFFAPLSLFCGTRAYAQTMPLALAASPLGGKVCAAYGVWASDGKITVAGVASDAKEQFHACLWRFAPDGKPDGGWGNGGAACSSETEWPWAMSSGGGNAYTAGILGGNWLKSPAAFARCTDRNAKPCAGFGADGLAKLPSPAFKYARAFGIKTAGDSVVVAGSVGDDAATYPALWRLASDGKPDKNFGEGGLAVLKIPDTRDAQFNALLPDGKGIIAAGTIGWHKALVWETKSDGSADKNFGANGLAIAPDGMARAITILDGDILIGGFRYKYDGDRVSSEHNQMFLLDKNGAVKKDFGNGGETEIAAYPNQESFALALSSGAILTAGYADVDNKVKACAWEFAKQGNPAKNFGKDGALVLEDGLGGKETRIYALSGEADGAFYAAGFARGADGKMHLAIWKIKP
jgi:uncharacterized delta-60 repeat protein